MIYNTCIFVGIAINGYPNDTTDITIEFTSKNSFRWYITHVHLLVLPYMVTRVGLGKCTRGGIWVVYWLVCRGWSGSAHLVVLSPSLSYPFPTPKYTLMDPIWMGGGSGGWWFMWMRTGRQQDSDHTQTSVFLIPFQCVCITAPSINCWNS